MHKLIFGASPVALVAAMLLQVPSPDVVTLIETRAELTTDYELLQRDRQQVSALSTALGPFCSQRLAVPALTARRTYCNQKYQDLRKRDVDLANQMDGLAVHIRQINSQLAQPSHR